MILSRRRVLGLAALPALVPPLLAHGGLFVAVTQLGFTPETAEVHVGETVVFYNDDTAAHRIVADNRSFDTGKLSPGDVATVQIDFYGSHFYHCALTPGMRGNIVAG